MDEITPPPAVARRPRLLIFIVAYYAESTLAGVLERIPREIFARCDCEILIVDDASEDRTFEIGRAYRKIHPEIRMTVLRNIYNQGYGGNQKIGYAYAIEEGFDWVALVHGDGQYAPEQLPKLIEPLEEERAEAVFGSRMLARWGAIKGGMPLYKFFGNRLLTFLQNLILGSNLSEFHSGYRLYSVAALRRVPFRLNANDFHFDTEIIIQFLNAGFRIVELPIPTFYGDEICRVNGIAYAANVLLATVRNRFHRAGLLYRRPFDTHADTFAAPKFGYPSSHTYALEAVAGKTRVAVLGGDADAVAAVLRREGATVIARADGRIDAEVADCDAILLLDLLARVDSPEHWLEELRACFDHRPRLVVVTVPNVAFLVTRAMLLLGQFNYGRKGILDRTQRRLFTFRALRRLLREEGFRLKRLRGVPAPFPKALGDGRTARFLLALNRLLIGASRGLFSYQIVAVAESTPSIAFLLEAARRSGR